MWIVYALLSAFTAALVAILGKVGISDIDTTIATTLRAVVMVVFLICISLALGKSNQLATLDRKSLLFIILSGIAGATSWLFYFSALKEGTAHGVVALDRLSIVMALLMASLFLHESITWWDALGALMMTTGALLMIV